MDCIPHQDATDGDEYERRVLLAEAARMLRPGGVLLLAHGSGGDESDEETGEGEAGAVAVESFLVLCEEVQRSQVGITVLRKYHVKCGGAWCIVAGRDIASLETTEAKASSNPVLAPIEASEGIKEQSDEASSHTPDVDIATAATVRMRRERKVAEASAVRAARLLRGQTAHCDRPPLPSFHNWRDEFPELQAFVDHAAEVAAEAAKVARPNQHIQETNCRVKEIELSQYKNESSGVES